MSGVLLLAAVPLVASLSVDAPPSVAARFARYVDLAPGRSAGPDDLRRAAELLHATGEIADVSIETRTAQEGLAVTLRPRPAPRLTSVVHRGDAVVSRRIVSRAARLRPREPLWPERLDAIGRDVALDLAERGWLEARVEASLEWEPNPFDGSRLVLDVHAGKRATVISAEVAGGGAERIDLLAGAKHLPGAPFVAQRAADTAEAMRAHLTHSGYWTAEVEVEHAYDPSAATVGLRFVVSPGPKTIVAFEGTTLSGSLERAVERILRDGRARPDAVEEAVERIEDVLRRLGHRQALVRRKETSTTQTRTYHFDVTAGPASVVRLVSISGMEQSQPALATRLGEPVQDTLLEADRDTLKAALEAQGFPEATVEFDVADSGDLVPVVFRVRPGPQVRVAAVSVEPSEPPEGAATELRLRVGEPYRVAEVAADRSAVLGLWRGAGYLAAEVEPEVSIDPSTHEATVTYRVRPGHKTLVDRIVVTGLGVTREKVVHRELSLRAGEPLRAGALAESQRRLATLAPFSSARLTEIRDDEGHSTVLASVEEGPRTSFAYGIGYSERELLRGSVEVSRRNLFGMDRSLSLYGRGSFRGNRFLATYREPWFFKQKREVFLTAFHEEEDRDNFDFRRNGGLLQTGRSLGGRVNLILRWLYQLTDVYNLAVPIDEIDREFRDYAVSGPSASIVRDTRDDPLEPTRGTFLGADGQLSLSALGGASYVKGFLQATALERVTARTFLVASARLGLARTFGEGQPDGIPLPERFFAGGDYGPRGFPTDGVGPLLVSPSAAVAPIGGNALLLGGAELRHDASRYLSLAAFADVGNVYPQVADLSLSDLRWSAGLGVRYKTPLGPIRVDWGYKLNRRAGESASRFHFTIGHAF